MQHRLFLEYQSRIHYKYKSHNPIFQKEGNDEKNRIKDYNFVRYSVYDGKYCLPGDSRSNDRNGHGIFGDDGQFGRWSYHNIEDVRQIRKISIGVRRGVGNVHNRETGSQQNMDDNDRQQILHGDDT